MSEKIENLRELFIEQGRELYDASRQEQKELPNIQKQARNQQLKTAINRQLDTAKDQSQRLQRAFKKLNVAPEGEADESSQSILKKTRNLLERSQDPEVRDAAIINSIQRLNHNKIATLGTLASYAREIGQDDIARSLHEALEAEKDNDTELSDLAEREINREAATA